MAKQAFLLNESDKLYKTLFNSISHELRIPVATIMGASDSLLTSDHPQEIRKELSHEIFKASKRLNRLIENLLNMSRLESGRITPRLDLSTLANNPVFHPSTLAQTYGRHLPHFLGNSCAIIGEHQLEILRGRQEISALPFGGGTV